MVMKDEIITKERAAQLPHLIDAWVSGGCKGISNELSLLTMNWMRHLVRNHYKAQQYNSQDNYERMVDRVVLFFQFVKEERKDGALLMSQWRWQIPALEVYLLLKHWRIAIADERNTVITKLRHPDIDFVKVLLLLRAKLERIGLPLTENNIVNEWVKWRTEKTSKVPGDKAIENFRIKCRNFEYIIAYRSNLEQSWVSSKSGNTILE